MIFDSISDNNTKAEYLCGPPSSEADEFKNATDTGDMKCTTGKDGERICFCAIDAASAAKNETCDPLKATEDSAANVNRESNPIAVSIVLLFIAKFF